MLDSLPIRIKYDNIGLFKDIPNIEYDHEADIQIMEWPTTYEAYNPDKYKILYITDTSDITPEMIKSANEIASIWVNTHEDRIKLQKAGLVMPVVVMSADKSLLPYCMKDRLAYLQDKINKEKGRYK